MEEQISLDRINQATYAREDVTRYYFAVDELLPAERAILEKLKPTIADSKILDIGVGGGRTVPHLTDISNDYVGIDYLETFVEEASRKYPDTKIMLGDARDLSNFDDDTFDFVLFSYNGLGSIGHEGRIKALNEVARVLKKGGTFLFSAHNRDYEYFRKLPWQRRFHFSKRYLIYFLHCLYHLPKHLKMRKLEIHDEDYAIINDGDHRYSLLLYYISIDKQFEQLRQAGFRDVEAFDTEGKRVTKDRSSHWIHYTAIKAAMGWVIAPIEQLGFWSSTCTYLAAV